MIVAGSGVSVGSRVSVAVHVGATLVGLGFPVAVGDGGISVLGIAVVVASGG